MKYSEELHILKGNDSILVEVDGTFAKISQKEYLNGNYKKYFKPLNPGEQSISVIFNGEERCMKREEYKNLKNAGENIRLNRVEHTKGKVVVKILDTGEHKIIPKEEYYANKHLYKTFGSVSKKK